MYSNNTYRSEGNTNPAAPNSVETVEVDSEGREPEVEIGYVTGHEGGYAIVTGHEYEIALECECVRAIAMGPEDDGLVRTDFAA